MKIVLVLVFCLFAGCIAELKGWERVGEFTEWTQTHEKSYSDKFEFKKRFSVWLDNMEFIETFAKKNPDATFTVSMNKFGDLTNNEFSQIYNGLLYEHSERVDEEVVQFNPEVPTSVDWRTKNVVTPAKNQGQCGSCYSFSTTGSTEGCHAITTGNLVSLSEQNIMDCSTSYGNQGCNGGLMTNSMQYIINNNGDDTEESYPYEAAEGTCRFNANNVGATLTSFTNVQQYNEQDLTDKIVTGPTSVAIDASHSSFQFYSGGVYYEAQCSQTQLDHGVLAVGYGVQSGQDYYIVKNSWGQDWGIDNGYILMSRNRNNNCGIATMATLPHC